MTDDETKPISVPELLKSTDAYIEYATATKKYSDVAYYERIKLCLQQLDAYRGTPQSRFHWLLSELQRRFPPLFGESACSTRAPEQFALDKLDIALNRDKK